MYLKSIILAEVKKNKYASSFFVNVENDMFAKQSP